ncbi:MAG: formate--tetrahydrofolate ligase [Proteobacteria bacterium]|nr:formate--tetrahydrofolate ligase [Pseudomonadota bacterium]
MSKIEKALKRAEQKRRSILTGGALEEKLSETSARQKEEAKPRPLVKNIRYTQTRKIQVDREVLARKKVMVIQNGRSRAAEEYRLLKAQVLKKARDKGWNVLMVTSAGRGEGKTLTAINLALAISREVNETSLLVEADLRQPSIEGYFGLRGEPGLTDHLLRNRPLPDVLINPEIDRFVFLPGGKSIPNSAETLGSPKMQDLVAEMKRRYPDRYVIFDVPPLFECSDPLVLSEYVDGVLLVVEACKTTTDHLKRAMELLEGKKIIGTVLNKVRGTDKRYYRYYR